MDDIFKHDPLVAGAKGLVLIGGKILVYRRDGKTEIFPHSIDLPGGGSEGNESPFETFKRELKEEFGLDAEPNQIIYAKSYQSVSDPSKLAYFLVSRLPEDSFNKIIFGDEGEEYFLIDIDEYLDQPVAWPVMRDRVKEYLAAQQN